MARPAPVAVASVHLSEDDRRRVAKELGLDESQLDAVPAKVDIERFDIDDDSEVDDDVSGFSFIPGLNPVVTAIGAQTAVSPTTPPSPGVGRIPGGLLVPRFPQ